MHVALLKKLRDAQSGRCHSDKVNTRPGGLTFPLRQGQDFPLRVWRSQPLGRTIEFDLESGDISLDCQGLVWATQALGSHRQPLGLSA